ncbi:MAG: UbiX family flavin prenyltransferase [Deltaproteobacteria bacterium]|nr:UbiX family flavin prenyltransferase [Deltaproteobacteria bacterium]
MLSAYLVAITGASGALYGVRLISELLKRGDDCELIVSPSGFLLLKEELGIGPEKVVESIKARAVKSAGAKKLKGSLKLLPYDDLAASAASGSALKKTMIICPCSMGTLARIAAGISGNLIERAADCVLKERGALVLVPRETPLSSIHLENMLKLSRAGAVILPAMPAFYQKPATIDDMADFIVGKVLDVLGIENSLYKRWKK